VTFEDASRAEIELAVKATIGFIRGIVCCGIERGVELDELDGALSRPELADRVMEAMENYRA
jgi:hypothetical protein